MKKICFIAVMLFGSYFSTTAQTSASKIPVKELKKTITLLMPRSVNDEMPGTRGASVAWHPQQMKYYASMAGNAGYPLAVFDNTGKRLSNDTLNCQVDTRGLWYNTATRSLEGNTYSDESRGPSGLFRYDIDPKGRIKAVTIFSSNPYQLMPNAVMTINPKTQILMYQLDALVYRLKASNGQLIDSLSVELGHTAADGKVTDFDELEGFPETYNATSMLYTGIKGAEWGFLNFIKRQIELYDEKTHFLTRIYQLPEGAVTESMFNLAFCNNQFWLFDMDTRTWTGYKM